MATSILLQLTTTQPQTDVALKWLKQQAPESAISIVNPDSTLSIDQVRQLQNQASYRPYHTSHQWFVISQIDQASLPAQNALLKILEEPPQHTSLLLTTSQVNLVIPTIQSRCQVVLLESSTTDPNPSTDALGLELLQTVSQATTFSELITWAEPLKDRSQAQAVLHAALQQLHQHPVHPSTASVAALSQLSQGLRWLAQNGNVKMTVEQTLFQLKKSGFHLTSNS